MKNKETLGSRSSKSVFFGKFSSVFSPFKPYDYHNYECELTSFAESSDGLKIDSFRLEKTKMQVWYAFWVEKEDFRDYRIVCR